MTDFFSLELLIFNSVVLGISTGAYDLINEKDSGFGTLTLLTLYMLAIEIVVVNSLYSIIA